MRPGITLIAGTGSACYGRNADGQRWRSGSWGQLIGDEGSSYWLGVQAMRATIMAYDGRGEKTKLETAVLMPICHLAESELPPVLGACLLARTSHPPADSGVILLGLKTAVAHLSDS